MQQVSKLGFMVHESNEITKEEAASVASVLHAGNITVINKVNYL